MAQVHLARGLLANRLRDTSKAEFYFDQAIRLVPTQSETFFQKGLMYLTAANRFRGSRQTSRYSRAVPFFSIAINLNPREAAAYEARGWARLAMGWRKLARDDFERAFRLDSKYLMSFDNWSEVTRTAESAIEFFDAQIELNPTAPAWRHKRGCAYFALGEREKALSDFRSAEDLEPEFALPVFAAATVALLDKDRRRASALIEKVREKRPNHPMVYRLSGEFMLMTGEPMKAVGAFSGAIRSNPTSREAFVARGVAQAAQKDWHAALVDFQSAQILDPVRLFDLRVPNQHSLDSLAAIEKFRASEAFKGLNPVELFSTANRLARISHEGEQAASDLALILFDLLVAKEQEVGLCFLSRAVLLQKRGDLDRALEDFNRAIELEPRLSRALNNRGNLYLALGQRDAARSDYEAAIALAPNFAWPLRNLSLLLRETEPALALKLVNSALLKDVSFVEAYEDRAWVYERLGNEPAATVDLLLAARLRDSRRTATRFEAK